MQKGRNVVKSIILEMVRQKTRRRRRKQRGKKVSNFSNALRRLKKLKASDQQEAMKMANATFIRQFCQVLRKLKHTRLSAKKRRALQKYKRELRQLVGAKTSISKRRHLLSQKGGGILKSILSAIPIVGNVLSVIDSI